VVLLVMACGPAQSTSTSFIALDQDFQNFQAWPSYSFDGGVEPGHPAGPRTVYINEQPAPGSTSFAKGTVIVKVLEFTTFAMAKRGETYNASGAAGWEWFELFRDPGSAAVSIVWRGTGPPAGEVYGKTGATCNQCHGGHTSNDSVLSPPLQLVSAP
jgi:hypothetical protein